MVLADLKKYHRKMYDQFGLEIKNILEEIGNSLRKEVQISDKDCHQFIDITRKNVDHLEIYTRGGSE